MKKMFTTIILLTSFVIGGRAQFFNYLKSNAVIAGNLTYTDLATSGTAITTNYKGQPMTFDDDNSSIQNIGFNFSFAGTVYTQFVLNTNGFIRLGTDTTSISDSYDVLDPGTTTTTNVIYPLNMDLKPSAGTTEYRVYTSGTSGSQVCTIQFKGVIDNGYDLAAPPSAVQYDYLEFQIKLYEGSNNVEFVYGNFTANLNTSGFVPSNCGLKSVDATRSLNVSKSSQTNYTSAAFIEGPYPGNRFNTRNSLLPSAGFTIRFIPVTVYNSNAAVQTVYALGKTPKNYDHSISVYVQNIGNTIFYNYPVTLRITGANTFTNVQYIDTLKSNVKKMVTFSNFTSPNVGINKINISIPADDALIDDTAKLTQTVTNTTISTVYDTTVYGYAGVGSSTTGSGIDLATRIKCPIANSISSISTYFKTAGKTFKILVYKVSGDTPYTQIAGAASGTLTSVAGLNVFTPTTPIAVTGDFFIVVRQTNTAGVNYTYGYQFEDPIRPKTFYGRSPAATTSPWFDMSPGNTFKLMVDVTMTAVFTPIKLTDFTGVKEGKTNVLKWHTATEINDAGFEVQRSIDGKNFDKIGFVNSKANNGNSSAIIEYTFTDEEPLKTSNYYRLRQLDKDGKEYISNVVFVKNGEVEKAEIFNIYPNPTNENVSIIFTSIKNENYNIIVTDIFGKIVKQQSLQAQQGSNKINIISGNFAAGTYFVKVVGETNETVATTKFVKL